MTAYGLMLHHFKGGIHPEGQGAITAEQFASMIDYLGPHNFLHPDEWMQKSKRGQLRDSDRCVTFDDSLLCQYEIAKPVLDHYQIQAFWFIYSSVLEGNFERLEIYRHYRSIQFHRIEDFYEAFFSAVSNSEYGSAYDELKIAFDPSEYLSEFTFYSNDDKLFRYTRDRLLGPRAYFRIMDEIINHDENYSIADAAKSLWMKDSQLQDLVKDGHVIGLHSHSHPTDMKSLPRDEQAEEYARNHSYLTRITGIPPRSMSHPCGSYNADTLGILHDLGVEVGFVASLTSGNGTLLEQPRNDHSHVAIEMGMRCE